MTVNRTDVRRDSAAPDEPGLFRAIFEQAAVGVAQVETATGRFLCVNQHYADLVGYTRAELEQLDFQTLTHPEDLAADLAGMRQLVAGDIRSYSLEKRYVRRDGGLVWVLLRVSALWAPGEVPSTHLAVVADITDRKRAEAALQASEEEHRLLIQHLHAGVVVHAADTRILLANAQASVVLGLSPEQMQGKVALDPAWSFVREDESPMPLAEYPVNQVVATRQSIRDLVVGINRPLTRDRAWGLVNAFPELDEAGGLRRVVVTFVDITERKRAEKEREQYFRFFMLSTEAMCIADPFGRFLRVNPAFARMTGFTEGELVARPFLDFVVPEDRQRTLDEMKLQVGARPSLLFENRYGCKDGSVILLSWTAYFDRHDGLTYATARDITEQRRAQETLAASEEQLRALSANLADGMVYQIGSGPDRLSRRFTYVSPAVERMHGLTVAELLQDASLLYRQMHEEDRPRVAELEARALATRSKMEVDVRVRLPTGEIRWRRFTSSPHVSADGAVLWDGIEMDITERKQAAAEQAALQAQLAQAQKMESIGRLAGGVAHDFNNMLQAILGHVTLARDEAPAGSRLEGHLVGIQHSAERSADLTRQLLACARKQAIQPRVLDLNETVAKALQMLRRLLGETLELVWTPGPDLWPVKVDASQMDQVLANLCVNARDALAGAGRVVIETRNVALDAAAAAALPECVPGDYVLLAVSDNGSGMDAATLAHLFEPFFTTKGLGKGTGLGLATVFGIVRQSQGTIVVESAPARGSTFRIYLPRAGSGVERLPPASTHLAGGTETVLVAEDEVQVLEIAELVLRARGYRVLAASAPEAALALAQQHPEPIHLLLADVVMPGMNGKELWDRVRECHPETRCLFMSGYTADIIAHHGIISDHVNFLQKPFPVAALAEAVRKVLGSPLPDGPRVPAPEV